jgi:hypothetical protein
MGPPGTGLPCTGGKVGPVVVVDAAAAAAVGLAAAAAVGAAAAAGVGAAGAAGAVVGLAAGGVVGCAAGAGGALVGVAVDAGPHAAWSPTDNQIRLRPALRSTTRRVNCWDKVSWVRIGAITGAPINSGVAYAWI